MNRRGLGIPLPETARRTLPAISSRLGPYTLLEFKGPTDALEYGDWSRLVACAYLFLVQSGRAVKPSDVTLMVVAPALTAGFIDELAAFGHRLIEEHRGVHRIEGAPFRAFVVEADPLAGQEEPALTMVSRPFASDPARFLGELIGTCGEMVRFAIDQIEHMRTTGIVLEADPMAKRVFKTLEQMEADWLARMPPEKRMQGIPEELRLQGIPLEKRLSGLKEQELAELELIIGAKKAK